MNIKLRIVTGALVSTTALSAASVAWAAPMPPTMVHARVLSANVWGTVTAINGTTLTIVKKDGTSLSIDTTNAKMIRRFRAITDDTEFSVGDHVIVRGTWTDSTKTTITAKVVQDMSIQMRQGTFSGKVTSLNGNGFVLAPKKRGTQTVVVDNDTKFYGKTRKMSASLSNIQVGDAVILLGVWDRTLNKVTDVTYVRDLSYTGNPTTQSASQ